MKQKTAMQELIETINDLKSDYNTESNTDLNYWRGLVRARDMAQQLLEKEKEQIMEAFWTGENFSDDYFYPDLNKTVTNENYYNETYKQY